MDMEGRFGGRLQDPFAALSEGLAEGCFVTDLDGRVCHWNPAAEALTGRARAQVLGRPWHEALGAPPGEDVAPPGPGWCEWVCRGTRANGQPLAVKGRVRLLLDAAGRPAARLWLFSDATVRDRMGRKMVAYERLASLGELTASIVHEVGNPVSVILGFARLLMKGDPDPDGAVRRRIYEEAARCRELIDQLLRYARSAGAGRSPGPVPLRPVVDEVVALLSYRMRRKGVGVEQVWDEGVPRVWADAGELKQVVLNLLLNAIDASPPGERIRVEGEAFERAVPRGGDSLLDPVLRTESERWVRLRVGDRGPGLGDIPPERCFEPFFTTKETGGGLGLTVCRRIVEACGGRVSLEPREGGGVWAVVELPGLKEG